MSASLLFIIIAAYFALLMVIARLTSRHNRENSFFDGDKSSPWFLVAFGMVGSGISAVSLVSIPGNVGNNHLYYFQFILGTIVGYLFIAFVLVPLYYKLQVVSIYSYLQKRFGDTTYKTGSLFFLVSQSFGAALRLLLSVKILQAAFFDGFHIPYFVTIIIVQLLIWLYTHQSGIKTIVWTDALQSFFLITVIIVSIYSIQHALGLSGIALWQSLIHHPYSRIFNWGIHAGSNFFKQFTAGLLITVALVGLDQSMMQKTLTIREPKDARKNVLSFSFFIAAAQTLFLLLGILLYLFVEKTHIQLPTNNGQFLDTDKLYPFLTLHYFGQIGAIAFFVGVVASTFATIDSCITALTTAISYDFLKIEEINAAAKNQLKNKVLIGVNLVLFFIVLAFWKSEGAIINTIFTIAGYTYGPLLGLYMLGLFSSIRLKEKWVPVVCILAAAITWLLQMFSIQFWQFDFGFMNIAVNALFTIFLLWCIQYKKYVG
jgi:Na+/proline symporter